MSWASKFLVLGRFPVGTSITCLDAQPIYVDVCVVGLSPSISSLLEATKTIWCTWFFFSFPFVSDVFLAQRQRRQGTEQAVKKITYRYRRFNACFQSINDPRTSRLIHCSLYSSCFLGNRATHESLTLFATDNSLTVKAPPTLQPISFYLWHLATSIVRDWSWFEFRSWLS